MKQIPCEQFNSISDIAVGTIINKVKLTAILAMDKLHDEDFSSIHILKLGLKVEYLQCLKISTVGECFVYQESTQNIIVLTFDSKLMIFEISTTNKNVLQENGKRRRIVFCSLTEKKKAELTLEPKPEKVLLYSGKMLVYGGTFLSVFNNETEMSLTVEPILAIARHKEQDVLYVVYKSSPNNIRTIRMADGVLVDVSNPITVTEEVTLLVNGFQGLLYIVTKRDQIFVHTELDFVVKLWGAVQNGYIACGYESDKVSAKNAAKPSNEVAKKAMGVCCQFLDEWDSKKKEVLGKVNVMGKHGNVTTS